MKPQAIDQNGRSTIASAEAQTALASGDTELAKTKYSESGELLENDVAEARTEEEEHQGLRIKINHGERHKWINCCPATFPGVSWRHIMATQQKCDPRSGISPTLDY